MMSEWRRYNSLKYLGYIYSKNMNIQQPRPDQPAVSEHQALTSPPARIS